MSSPSVFRALRGPRASALALLAASLAGCAPTGGSYYPLDAGRWWDYAVRETVLDETHQARYVQQNAGIAPGLDGSVFLQLSQGRSADFLRPRGSGVERIASLRPGMRGPQPDEKPRVVLPESLALGAHWEVHSTLALIESRTFEPRDRIIPRRLPVTLSKAIAADDVEVEVPAGRFERCLLIEGRGETSVPADRGNASARVEVEVREWYAPNVGLVKLARQETTDSTFFMSGQQHWELLDYGR